MSSLESAVIRHDPSFQVVIDDSLALWNFMICRLTGVWCFPYSLFTSRVLLSLDVVPFCHFYCVESFVSVDSCHQDS